MSGSFDQPAVSGHVQRWEKHVSRAAWFLVCLTLLLTLVALLMPGCTVTPRHSYAQMNDAYIVTLEVLVDAKAAGAISAEDWQAHVVPLIIKGSQALDVIDEATKRGEEAPVATSTLRDVLRELEPYIVKHKDTGQ